MTPIMQKLRTKTSSWSRQIIIKFKATILIFSLMTDMLKEELPKIGYSLRTPLDSYGPLVVAWKENAREILTPLLNDENIQISTYNDRIRISPTY